MTERAVVQLGHTHELQRDEARRYLDVAVRREVGDSRRVQTRLLEAAPGDGILMAASEYGAGLIVMGTHGRGGLNRLLMGSVAERVVRQAAVPVLTVRGIGEDASECRRPFRRILCPINYTEVAREALRYAVDLARRFESELIVMTSLEGEAARSVKAAREQERKLCDWVPENVQASCMIEPIVCHGDAAEQIIRTASEEDGDLIVIGAQHRPLLETTIFGTTSVRVMRHAACPVLTVARH